MTDTRARRQRAITHLVRSNTLGSQEELADRLAEMGIAATQATISRDLDHLGAMKVRRNGTVHYAMPDQIGTADWSARRLEAILREWVRSAEAAGNLVVLRTPPGSAHMVGVALDQAALPEIAGTICGDDTIFLAVRPPASADDVVRRLSV
ncbi:arginine repressor [Sphingomonas sp. GCM10030256]|uniref:arginine repressor n=1 Tax=Sphingomonas sp. GCM10030256 TaxID=3273427 RepID=UPI0036120DD7